MRKKVGISLKPKTSIDVVKNFLNKIDLVLIMSVEPGFSGQKFMPEVLNKVKRNKKITKEKILKIDIEIDGGINFEIVKLLLKLEQTCWFLVLLSLSLIMVTLKKY